MANRTTRTAKKDVAFLAALADGKAVGAACSLVGYRRRSVYEWREADPAFRQQWDDAITQAVELMEAEADRRAVKGTLKPVFQNGKRVGSVREFSDTLLIFRLKALAPEKYRERHDVKGGLNLSLSHEDALTELE